MRRLDIAEVLKFTYLKSLLIGRAARAVKDLAHTNGDYVEAIKVVHDRYGNQQIIVNSHIISLTRVPEVSNDNDTAKVRERYDKAESNLRSLRALGIEADSYGCILVPILKNNFPKEINVLLSRKLDPKNGLWKIEEILGDLRIDPGVRE